MRRIRATVSALLLVALTPALVLAAKPVSETFTVDDHFLDTELCRDFDVQFDATGHIRISTYFDKQGNAVMDVNNFAVQVSYSANGNVVTAVDTGLDHFQLAPDGTAKLSIIGNLQLVTSAGSGVVGGSAGITILTFDENGELVSETPKGKRAGDQPICELLAA